MLFSFFVFRCHTSAIHCLERVVSEVTYMCVRGSYTPQLSSALVILRASKSVWSCFCGRIHKDCWSRWRGPPI